MFSILGHAWVFTKLDTYSGLLHLQAYCLFDAAGLGLAPLLASNCDSKLEQGTQTHKAHYLC